MSKNWRTKLKDAKIFRKCLNCKKPFATDSKYTRMCVRCKNTAEWHEGNDQSFNIGKK